MNRFELWDKVARNSQCRFPQHFRLVVALWSQHTFAQDGHSQLHTYWCRYTYGTAWHYIPASDWLAMIPWFSPPMRIPRIIFMYFHAQLPPMDIFHPWSLVVNPWTPVLRLLMFIENHHVWFHGFFCFPSGYRGITIITCTTGGEKNCSFPRATFVRSGVCVCPRVKMKTTKTKIAKLGIDIVHLDISLTI